MIFLIYKERMPDVIDPLGVVDTVPLANAIISQLNSGYKGKKVEVYPGVVYPIFKYKEIVKYY